MEMTLEQLEQLSANLYQSIAGNVERRLEEWWQNPSGSSGKGGGEKGGHALIEPKYLSRVFDFLGDERSWKDWFASLTTAVIQMYHPTCLTRWKGQKITSSCTLGPTTRCTCVGKATILS